MVSLEMMQVALESLLASWAVLQLQARELARGPEIEVQVARQILAQLMPITAACKAQVGYEVRMLTGRSLDLTEIVQEFPELEDME